MLILDQQIVSDSLHPYFSSYGNDISPAKPSIGKEYHGDIKNAYWINAGDLKKGYKVLGSNGEWQVISEVYTVKTPLNSYNLEVNTDHTFFVKGIGGLDGVWVHNKDCWYIIPSEATTQTKNGQKIYTFEDRGRTVNIIENPEWSATGGKAKYFEVDADGKILNENEPNIHRATNRPAQNDNHVFVKDPLHPPKSAIKAEGVTPEYLITDRSSRLYNSRTLHPTLPDPIAGWDFKPSQINAKPGSSDSILNSQINGFVHEIDLANKVANEGFVVLKWGDKPGTHGSDVISIDPKSETVVLWDNKFRSDDGTLEISPTFDINAKTASGDSSGAWKNAKQEAIDVIQNSNLPAEQKIKLAQAVADGNFETRTVGSGALDGQIVIQKYTNGQKVK